MAADSRRSPASTTQRRPALRALVALVCGLMVAAVLGCQLLPGEPSTSPRTEEPSPTVTNQAATATATPRGATPTPTTDITQPFTITLWVPVELGATAEQGSDGLLEQAIERIVATSPQARVVVLPKAIRGPGGIPELLAAMQPLLPGHLPDAALVNAADIPGMVERGLALPLDDVLLESYWDDLYPFARQAVSVDGGIYGAPLDAVVTSMFYNAGMLDEPPTNWEELAALTGRYLLPLRRGDGAAFRILLSHYFALGGSLRDDDGLPTLDATLTARVLRAYWELYQAGVIPEEALSLDSADVCWAVYLTGEAAVCSATSYQYWRDRGQLRFTRYAPQASLEGTAPAIASTRAWVVLTADPLRQDLLAQLFGHSALPARAAGWLKESHRLPVSRAPLPLMIEDEDERSFWDAQLAGALTEPDAATSDWVRPVLERALQDVLDGSAPPEQAAVTAALAVESTR